MRLMLLSVYHRITVSCIIWKRYIQIHTYTVFTIIIAMLYVQA